MKHITLIIIAVLFSVTAFAQQTFDNDFTQTKVMKVSGKTINKAGHIVFDGKDQLKMTYTEPSGDSFDADKVKMVGLQRSTLLNCLSGNWEQAAADNNAETTITEEKGLKVISINAKGKVPRGGFKSVVLTYRTKDGGMTKMVLEEATGIINTYKIK